MADSVIYVVILDDQTVQDGASVLGAAFTRERAERVAVDECNDWYDDVPPIRTFAGAFERWANAEQYLTIEECPLHPEAK